MLKLMPNIYHKNILFNTFVIMFPLFKQTTHDDCGPACLHMIAEFYGKRYSIRYLTEISKPSENGVTLANLSNALDTMVFKTLCVKMPLKKFFEKALLPCILFLNSGHFVVLYKIKGTLVFLADPTLGLIALRKPDFKNRWCVDGDEGVAILLEMT